jgi:molybdopterin molybdotransferase
MKSFISLEEAIDILDANVKAIGTEEVELIKATGRIISEDIYSKIDNPPFNKSAMDGYAIIAEDSNGCNEIKVIDKVFAGEVSKAEVINKTAGSPH